MNVLVIEPNPFGHRLSTAGLLLSAIVALPGCRTFLATSPIAAGSEQFEAWIRPLVNSAGTKVIEAFTDPASTISAGEMLRHVSIIRALIREHAIDHVFIPSGDGFVQVATAARLFRSLRCRKGVQIESMMLRGRFAYEPPTTFRAKLTKRFWFNSVRYSPMDVVHHMDPLISDAVLREAPSLGKKLRAIPDAVDPIEPELTTRDARQKLGIPLDGRIAGCVGVIDIRKGISLLLDGYAANIQDGRLDPGRDRLLLVGKQDAYIANMLATSMKSLVDSGSIITIPRFVSDVEMSNAISAMDLMVTPYPNHIGSASIAIRAAAQRRPVLASNFGWLGFMVPTFELGSTCEVLNPKAFADALPKAFESAGSYQQNARARRFVEFCSVRNVKAHWVQHLCRHLGIEPPAVLRWDDLLREVGVASSAVR